MADLYLCGASNSEGVRLALCVQEQAGHWKRILLLDDDPVRLGRSILGVPVVGPLSALGDVARGDAHVVNLIARTTAKREAARTKIARYGHPFASLVHPGVDVRGVELADDVLVYERAIVSPEACVGPGSVLFMGAIAGHESRIGAGCVLAAGCVLNARVVLGDFVYVGTNAAVLPEVRVGAGATVGASSAVLCDVPEGATALGVPAEILVAPVGSHATDGSAAPRPLPEASVVAALEATIRAVWSRVLGRSSVGPEDGFFDVGGTSLLALRACARMEREEGLRVAPTDMFRFPTARSLAQYLAGAGGGATGAVDRGAVRRQALHRRVLMRPP
jgi:carbonic anhydrase/acetyltransferase-like protein (isoleucine patch superfamily)